MRSMKIFELAKRMREVVAPFASAQQLEDIDDDLFVGEEGIALSSCLWIATQHNIAVPNQILAEMHAAREILNDKQRNRLDGLSRAAA